PGDQLRICVSQKFTAKGGRQQEPPRPREGNLPAAEVVRLTPGRTTNLRSECSVGAEEAMTEAEWKSCTRPTPMLEYLRDKASDRKLRLFACACCRCIWDRFPDPCNRDMVAAVEDYPDGKFEDPKLYEAIVESSAREVEFINESAYWVAK